METLKFCKVRKVKNPNRAHSTDAGIDFFIPEDLTKEQFLAKCDITRNYVDFELNQNGFVETIILSPRQSVLIPSGIHVKIPDGYALIFMNKSGIATKKYLHIGASVVDQCYFGECHINLTNVGDCNVRISAGEKIAQGLLIPVLYSQLEEYPSVDKLYENSESDRKSGGFGSTGTK